MQTGENSASALIQLENRELSPLTPSAIRSTCDFSQPVEASLTSYLLNPAIAFSAVTESSLPVRALV